MPTVWSSNICGVTAVEAVHYTVSHGSPHLHAAECSLAPGHHLHWSLCDLLQHGRRHFSCGVHRCLAGKQLCNHAWYNPDTLSRLMHVEHLPNMTKLRW